MTQENLKNMNGMIQKNNPDNASSKIQKVKSGIFHYSDIIKNVHI